MTALRDVPGIGPAIEVQLRAAGYATVADVVGADPNDLVAIRGIGAVSAQQIVAAAALLMGPASSTGERVSEAPASTSGKRTSKKGKKSTKAKKAKKAKKGTKAKKAKKAKKGTKGTKNKKAKKAK